MNLKEIPIKELEKIAKKADTKVSYLIQIRNGHRRPSPELAERIEEATGGLVTRMELLYPQNSAA